MMFRASRLAKPFQRVIASEALRAPFYPKGPARFFFQGSENSEGGTKLPIGGLAVLYAYMPSPLRRYMGLNPQTLFALGKRCFEWVLLLEGLSIFEQMLLVSPRYEELPLYKEAGDILFANTYYDEAAKFWSKSANQQELHKLYVQAGEQLFKKGKIIKGIEFYEKSATPNLPTLYEQGAEILCSMNKEYLALSLFKKAIQNNKQSFHAFIHLGYERLKRGNCVEALEYYERAYLYSLNFFDSESLECNHKKNAAFALNQLGVAKFMEAISNGKTNFYNCKKSSIQYFIKALQLDRNNPIVMDNFNVVKTLNAEPEFGQAFRYFAVDPRKPTALFDPILFELRNNAKIKDYSPSIKSRLGFTFFYGRSLETIIKTSMGHVENYYAINELMKLREPNWDAMLHLDTEVTRYR